MAFSDIFYPDNPKRREKVIRLHQELISCMESNFYVTNDLIGMVNTQLGCKITPIKMNENGTIKENCDIFIETRKKIQEVLQNIDEELKEKLEPSLYLKLRDITESDTTKMKKIESYSSIISGLAGTAASAAVIKLMIKKIISESMSKMAAIMVKIGVSVFGLVAGAVVGIGVDMIISAIEGAIERKQLEESIQELEGHLKEFKPASREYQRDIVRVTCTLEQKI